MLCSTYFANLFVFDKEYVESIIEHSWTIFLSVYCLRAKKQLFELDSTCLLAMNAHSLTKFNDFRLESWKTCSKNNLSTHNSIFLVLVFV